MTSGATAAAVGAPVRVEIGATITKWSRGRLFELTLTERNFRPPKPASPGSRLAIAQEAMAAKGFFHRNDPIITALRAVWPVEHLAREVSSVQSDGRHHKAVYYRSPVEGVDLDALLLAVQLHAVRSGPTTTYRAAAREVFGMSASDVEADMTRAVTISVDCGGAAHRLEWDGGKRLVAVDHDGLDLEAERTLCVLGGRAPAGCPDVLDRWSTGRGRPDIRGFEAAMEAAQRHAGFTR